MAGLFGILSIANQSIQAQQEGLQVTANNLANVNTPGYTRQVATLAEQAPYASSQGGGGGVVVQGVQSIRDSVLEIRIDQETQNQNRLSALQQQLGPVQSLFSATGGAGLGTAMDGFFSALQQLSTNPADGAQRTAVMSAAQTMTQTFQQVANAISQQRAGADQEVTQGVAQVNTLLGQIANLNGQIADVQNSNQNAGELVDQRTQLMQNLSKLIDFNTSAGNQGQVTLTTSAGSPLVVGAVATPLTLRPSGTGVQEVYSGTTDITASISGGSLAGIIQARDQTLPQLSSQLDQLASGLANAVNAQNALGYDATGAAGGNLFTPPAATGAAASLSLATTDPNAIAASGNGSTGDNSNLLAMEGLQQQAIIGGQTPDNAYASVISSIGSVINSANTQQQASSLVLTQLQNQRSSISGVSVDEESIALTQFQSAYQAAARVVGIINSLTSTAINLGKA
ncbi:MAG TPA: flagellar hook-associated protein FlgK [Terriglobales bacterium]|nr:flagellar hook-associated protein FlgK [Terriglobales bacterium]